MDGNNQLYKTASKLLRFKITIPPGYFGNPVFEVKNSAYGTNTHVEFCYMAVVASGNNVPCVIPDVSTTTSWLAYKTFNGYVNCLYIPNISYLYLQIFLCHLFYFVVVVNVYMKEFKLRFNRFVLQSIPQTPRRIR